MRHMAPAQMSSSKATGPKVPVYRVWLLLLPLGEGKLLTDTFTTEKLSKINPLKQLSLPNISLSVGKTSVQVLTAHSCLFFFFNSQSLPLHKMKRCPWMPPPLAFLFAKPQVAKVSLNKEPFPTSAGFTNIRFRKVAPNLQTELPNKIQSKDSLYFSLDQNLFANVNGRAFPPVFCFPFCLQLYVQKAIPFSMCSNYFTKIIIICIYPRSAWPNSPAFISSQQ